jgi:dipeptidyl-peptidase-4
MNLFHRLITAFFITWGILPNCGAQAITKLITIEDIYQKYTFYPKKISSFNSMNDGLNYTVLEGSKSIVKYDYETGSIVSTLFSSRETKISSISDYVFSLDEKNILLTTAKQLIYRHSYVADYYIYTIENKKLIPLSKNGKQQLATFSPDGKKIAFVRDNNLYLTDLTSMTETQITFDGKKNAIINGAPDWVYEEEFAFSKGFAWSPDSRKLAFYRFDESMVKEFQLTDYVGLYPESYTYKYPKAGEQN